MVIGLIESMRDAPLTFPTPNGGCHPLCVVGTLAMHRGRKVADAKRAASAGG